MQKNNLEAITGHWLTLDDGCGLDLYSEELYYLNYIHFADLIKESFDFRHSTHNILNSE